DGLRYLFQGPLQILIQTVSEEQAQLTWTGGEGFADVQASTNLITWTTLVNRATFPFTDSNAVPAGANRKYYRLAEPAGP
ncbi:MAG: hypothetical protein AAF492_20600, partial [Verrucomicrobiota bacterium]